jgi:hypothetical protein
MIAISIVAVWLVAGLMIGALFGTAVRKASGDVEETATPASSAGQVRYLHKGKGEPATVGEPNASARRKHATKHHAAA